MQTSPPETGPSEKETSKKGASTWFASLRQTGILLVLVGGFVIFSLTVPGFFNLDNQINGIALSAAIYAIVAVGMNFVIIAGGIDLSVGSVAALSAVVAADLMARGLPPGLGLLVGLLVGALAGLINGLLVARAKLAPFIVTLGTMSLYRGLALVYTNGLPILSLPDPFKQVIGGTIAGFPIPVLIAFGLVALGEWALRFTKSGQFILAIGGNEEAVRLSGVDVQRYVTLTFVICGLASALAAMVLIAQLGAAEPILGQGWELTAIASAVVGGTSLSGGRGNIVGALLGALLLSMLQNVLTLLNVQAFYQLLATGGIIIGAMFLDRLGRRE
jgi:ribose transport system permease protein